MVYPRISKDIPCISSLMDIHGYTWYIQGYTMYIPGICWRTTYTWYIPGICQAYSRHIQGIGVSDGSRNNEK
jgi:hypothetical protein